MSVKTPASLPWLASDTRRSFLAAALCCILTVILTTGGVAMWGPSFESGIVGPIVAMGSFCLLYTGFTMLAFRGMAPARFREVVAATAPKGSNAWSRALNGEGGTSFAVLLSGIAIALVAVVATRDDLARQPAFVILCAATVISAWLATAIAYALQYAQVDGAENGLRFPGQAEPVFADYRYLAFQLSTTFASSDVEVIRTGMRRLVTRHSVIAFAFNTVIVALLVSVMLRTLS